MDVSIIIIVNSRMQALRKCLLSIFRNSSGPTFEIIVVDAAGLDVDEKRDLASRFPAVIFVQLDTGIGRARANNLAVRHATGQHLLFLHPDTEFIENSVKILLTQLTSIPTAGAAGCQLLNDDRSIQTNCVQSFPTILNQILNSEYLRERFPESQLWGMRILHVNWPRQAQVEVVSGTCMLVKRTHFERAGGFTESYFMHGEDFDLCFKLYQSGAPVYYVPETRIVHLKNEGEGIPSDLAAVMMRDSVLQFMRLNRGSGVAHAYRASMIATAFVRLLLMGPLMLFGNRVVRHGANSWRKWFTILRWSIGLNALQKAKLINY